MRTKLFLILGLVALGAGVAMAEDMVLPVLAVSWPGKGGNLWSTEVFASNPGPLPVSLVIGPFLAGKTKVTTPCLPPIPFRHQLPPYSTQLLTSNELGFAIGCPDFAIGGLVFSSDTDVSLVARVANITGTSTASKADAIISGVGQQIPAIPASQLAEPGTTYQIPGLILDPNPCGAPRFESYLYIANPDPAKVDVTLQQSQDGKSAGSLMLSGRPVITPYTFTVPASGWQQFLVQMPGNGTGTCTEPHVVDLFFTTTGNLAVVGTVVDRGSQEPRTVLPLATTQ